MKKLIFFGYTLEVGGAEKVLTDYLKLLNNKYEITLCLLQKKGELCIELPPNIKVIELRKNNIVYAFFRYIPFYRKIVINRIINKDSYDVAIGFMEGRSATWVADIKKKIKKIAFIHNDVNKFNIGISKKEILNTYKNIDKIVTVSETAKESFCEKYDINNKKVDVLYNLIDEQTVKNKADEKVEKNDIFTFVNVGKMRPQKRQDRLIEIARDLKNKGYKFKIQIIGNGPEEDNIKDLIRKYKVEDCVELKGLQLNPYPYIKNANAVVVSSDFEGYSLSIKESLLLRKPVISTNVSGVSEMFENGKYGISTKVETEDLKNKMEDILLGRIDLKRIEKNLEKFDCGNNKILEKLEEIINEQK